MHFVLLREVLERSLADIHHHLENFAGESERRFIQLRDRRARITPDVEALVGGEVARNLFLEAASPDCFLSESKGDCAAGANLTFFVDVHLGRQHMASRRNCFGGRNAIVHLVVIVVLPVPYDLTRGGIPYSVQANTSYLTHTDVKQLAMYLEDTITKGPWSFNLGIRGDLYNGLTTAQEAEPRLGAAYNIHQSNTVLRFSYARTMETPFNENLILSSLGCANNVLAPLLLCSAATPNRLSPGTRNEYHFGLEQAFGKHLVFSGEYIWKYTDRGFDFSVAGKHPDHVSHRVEQIKDSGICWPRERAELSRILSADRFLQCGSPLLHSANRRSRCRPGFIHCRHAISH
jgi:hypothetical protein